MNGLRINKMLLLRSACVLMMLFALMALAYGVNRIVAPPTAVANHISPVVPPGAVAWGVEVGTHSDGPFQINVNNPANPQSVLGSPDAQWEQGTECVVNTVPVIHLHQTFNGHGDPNSSGCGHGKVFWVFGAPLLVKEFTDDPVLPGGEVTLEFTLDNISSDQVATGIGFTDDLNATLPGLVASGVQTNECGGQISYQNGGGLLEFTGGSLQSSLSCTFSVTLDVPADAAAGTYPNTTSGVTALMNGLPGEESDPATADLVVIPSAPDPPPGVCGDQNDDGLVDSADAAIDLQISAGLIIATPEQMKLSDVNHDGTLDHRDASIILQHAAGLLTITECGTSSNG